MLRLRTAHFSAAIFCDDRPLRFEAEIRRGNVEHEEVTVSKGESWASNVSALSFARIYKSLLSRVDGLYESNG